MNINNAQVISYADDTAVVFSGNSWDDVKTNAEKGLAQIATWLNSNMLTLNVSKTYYICFSIYQTTKQTEDLDIKTHVCGDTGNTQCSCTCIRQVTQTKYLGVIVDQRLSWYPHLDQVANRIRRLSWIFRTLRHVVPKGISNNNKPSRNILVEIYVALVQSVLTYCIPVWGGAAKTYFINLERAQRALIKIMFFLNRRYPTVSLYKTSDLLSVRKLYITQTIVKKHKELPLESSNLTKRRKDIVAIIPRTNTIFASRQLKKQSANLYNKINKRLSIYTKTTFECRKTVTKWIKSLTYDETEALMD